MNTCQLLEDVDLRRFINEESANYYKHMRIKEEAKKTHFIKLMALAQYGQAHEISLYASMKKDFKEVRYHQEVRKYYPIISELSQRYKLSERIVILTIITSMIFEIQRIKSREAIK